MSRELVLWDGVSHRDYIASDIERIVAGKIDNYALHRFIALLRAYEPALVDLVSAHIGIVTYEIGFDAFRNCKRLVSVDLPRSVMRLDSDCFNGCIALESISMPSVVIIFSSAFTGCTSLTTVIMPNVNYIGCLAFSHTAIVSIELSKNMSTINTRAFVNCTNLTTVVLPSQLEQIEAFAFAKCTSLVSITIPNRVRHIYFGAFARCFRLKTVEFKRPNHSLHIHDCVFEECAIEEVYLPSRTVTIHKNAFDTNTRIVYHTNKHKLE